MVDAHTLAVTTRVRFPSPQLTSASVSLTVNLNGTLINAVTAPTSVVLDKRQFQATTDPNEFIATLHVDLHNYDGHGAAVPRFADNIRTIVTLEAQATTSDGRTCAGRSATRLEVPLPVVHVHGMATDWSDTYDRIPMRLFTALQRAHPSYTLDNPNYYRYVTLSFFLNALAQAILHSDTYTDNIQEMCPVYPWYSDVPLFTDTGRVLHPSKKNGYLANLNALGLDQRVHYYTIVSSSYHGTSTLQALWGSNPKLWIIQLTLPGMPDSFSETGYGDGCVPLRSQLASDTGWPQGPLRGQISNLLDAGSVFHTDYFNNATVNSSIEKAFWIAPD